MEKLKLIGQGLFSKVYRLNDKEVLIKSICNVKEAISMEWHNSTGVFPKITRIDYQEYTCKYYEKVTSLKSSLLPDHYDIYQNLRALEIDVNTNPYDYLDAWRKAFKSVKNAKYRNALLNMLDVLSNYGTEMRFEISPRNVAVEKGKLILLDVFFFNDQRNQQFKNKSNKYAY